MKKSIRITMGAGLVLAIPLLLLLLAIWQWKPGVFVLGLLLLLGGAGITYGMVVKKAMNNRAYLLAVGVALAAVLLLAWMNAAVGGILGDNPANMMYFGVLLVGLCGAILAKLQPYGMSLALFAMAFAVLLVPAIAFYIGTPAFANGVAAVFGLHAIFAMLFIGAGLLFRKAAHAMQS